jgi:predicted dehydrogenase
MLSVLTVALGATAHGTPTQQQSRLSLSRVTAQPTGGEQFPIEADLSTPLRLCGGGEQCDVVLIGCGVPKRGMGWYHGKQMLEGQVPSAKLTTIVEPFFLGPGADSDAGKAFNEWAAEMTKKYGTKFAKSVDELELTGPTLALISGRTADNPRLLKEVIAKGVTHVYLEKPGAPTVGELQEMKKYAKDKGVPVYMGYNKNVTPYVKKALEFQAKNGGAVTFIHNNAYTEDQLGECFERNAEGMLKNMAIHELALLATYYGVTVENIKSVTPDAEYSSCQTLTGPSGKEFTDFSKVGFTIETKDGKTVTVKADRCGDAGGGGNSQAYVMVDGEEKFKSITPDDKLKKYCEAEAKKDPTMMPYFFLQHDDYITLKETATSHILAGADGAPEGMATIDIAVETLRVAEYLTPYLQKALKK